MSSKQSCVAEPIVTRRETSPERTGRKTRKEKTPPPAQGETAGPEQRRGQLRAWLYQAQFSNQPQKPIEPNFAMISVAMIVLLGPIMSRACWTYCKIFSVQCSVLPLTYRCHFGPEALRRIEPWVGISSEEATQKTLIRQRLRGLDPSILIPIFCTLRKISVSRMCVPTYLAVGCTPPQ